MRSVFHVRVVWLTAATTLVALTACAASRPTPSSAGAPSTLAATSAPRSVTVETLLTAEVPANCRLPAQRLRNGRTTKGSPGRGDIATAANLVAFADFAGLGYRQALTEYGCDAGGVAWPDVLILVGDQGKLLASYDLRGDAEHDTVRTVTANGGTALVAWDAYDGAGFQLVHHAGDFGYSHGTLVLTRHTVDYTASAVAGDINLAAYDGNRATLKDPKVVTDAQWRELVYAGGLGIAATDPCPLTGDTAACRFDGARPGDNPQNVISLRRAPGTVYGWRVTRVEIPTPSR